MGDDVYYMCLCCWRDGQIEKHHISGRANHSRVIPVCRTCHIVLTKYQRRSGISLVNDRSDNAELFRAIAYGYEAVRNLTLYKMSLNMSRDIMETFPQLGSVQPLYAFGTFDA